MRVLTAEEAGIINGNASFNIDDPRYHSALAASESLRELGILTKTIRSDGWIVFSANDRTRLARVAHAAYLASIGG